MHSLGKQIVAEFYHCPEGRLEDPVLVEQAMLEAARCSGATVVTRAFHQFSPHGVSGVVVIAESHFAIHTWPEYGYAAVDLFTCGDTVCARRAFEHLRSALGAAQVSTMELRRGQLDLLNPDFVDGREAAPRLRAAGP